MAAAPPEAAAEPSSDCPLRYSTCLLKVSIHCEGCKRKVKRVLHAIEGVYTVDVDAKNHKVAVTGNVDSMVLIRKLEKSGKHAELWPAPRAENNNTNNGSGRKSKKKGKRNDREAPPQDNEQQEQNLHDHTEEQRQKDNAQAGHDGTPPPPKHSPDQVPQAAPCTKAVQFANSPSRDGHVQTRAVKLDANIPPSGAGEHHPSAAGEEHVVESSSGCAASGASNGNGGAGGGRKKKKKGRNGNNSGSTNAAAREGGGAPSNYVPPNTESPNLVHGPPSNPVQVNVMRPPHHLDAYDCPVSYHGPPSHPTGPTPLPAYAVSYNTAYPTSTFTASYYAAPPLDSYAYVHQAADMEQVPVPFGWNVEQSNMQPSDTFEIFSDENPNACSLM